VDLPAGIRATPQRRAVLAAVERRRGAFAVSELLGDAGVGLATAYRTVELLLESGAVRKLPNGTYVRCHPGHHHHLICESCGAVEETELCAAPSAAVLRRRHGFVVHTHELEIYGTCRRCAA
jgi:Fur family ferric uptake transcriptional regulator